MSLFDLHTNGKVNLEVYHQVKLYVHFTLYYFLFLFFFRHIFFHMLTNTFNMIAYFKAIVRDVITCYAVFVLAVPER